MSAANPKPMVELKNVDVSYPNGVMAIENMNLDVFEKDFIGFVGPNGAGKSTIIKVILGLIKPDRGTVKLFSETPSARTLKQVGFIPQRAQALDTNFPATVFETVLFGRVARAGIMRRLGKQDYKRAEEVLKLLGINNLRDRQIGQLSGGQTQRVFLAKALVSDPKLLLLDEPTSGVDVLSRKEIYDALGRLNKEFGTTVILASHEVGIIRQLATKVVCLNKSILFCGEMTEFESSEFKNVSDACEMLNHDEHT